jgi:hypothetical protein
MNTGSEAEVSPRCGEGAGRSARIGTQDVFINLVEVAKENWSFGDGIAQYAPEEKQ